MATSPEALHPKAGNSDSGARQRSQQENLGCVDECRGTANFAASTRPTVIDMGSLNRFRLLEDQRGAGFFLRRPIRPRGQNRDS